MGKIFIPTKCRVGFQERDDTFAKKLAYVIYYGPKGDLRKEISWESWRHRPGKGMGYDGRGSKPTVDVTPYDFENVPTSGFILNKGHTRYAWSHFGSKTTVIRIYDPRGIEFEISPENLVALMMHTDCSKREIQGDLVYAWCGGNLMLLPCSSEEYKDATSYTSLQNMRVSAKDLKEGYTYITKNEEHLVYLGRHMWYTATDSYKDSAKREGAKKHIFCDNDGKNYKPVTSIPSIISKQISDGCHDEYANWVDAFLKTPESSRIVRWERKPLPGKAWEKDWSKSGYGAMTLNATIEEDGKVITVTIGQHNERRGLDWRMNKIVSDYKGPLRLSYKHRHVINEDGSQYYAQGSCYYPGDSDYIVTDKTKFFTLVAIYENGFKKKWSE